MSDVTDRAKAAVTFEDGVYKATGLTFNQDVSKLKFDVQFDVTGNLLGAQAFDIKGRQHPVPEKLRSKLGVFYGYAFRQYAAAAMEANPERDPSLINWENRLSIIRERACSALHEEMACGLFDGGCLAIADALQSVVGGEVVVLTRSNGVADHAAVLLDDKLCDFAGPLEPEKFIARFNSAENADCVCYRSIEPQDLQDAREYSETELKSRLHALFLEVLPDMAIEHSPLPAAAYTEGAPSP